MGGDSELSIPKGPKPRQRQLSTPKTRRRSGCGSVARFPKGSQVEVRTDEEDFDGVYFTATVISSPPASPRKRGGEDPRELYVEYHDLLAHEDGSDRLREHVDVSFVRPVPPLQEIVKGFEPEDIVDAFYKDGWWTGVVSRVVGGGKRFVVTFENPTDELEFGLADLRLHWDWVNGNWVCPQKKSITGLMFDVGRKVEVSFDGEGFQDVWFPATIHEDLGNGFFLVDYTDNNGQAVEAPFDSLHVRPCPPLLKDKNFVLLEKVDAFFDFGWRNGVVTKELESCRYVVFFKKMKQEKEFNQSELRHHMEWKDGKWFASSQEASMQSSNDGGVHEKKTHKNSNADATAPSAQSKNPADGKDISDGKTPCLSTSTEGHFEQSSPDIHKMSHVTTTLTKRRQHLSDSGANHSQLQKKLEEESLVGAKKPDYVNNIEISATITTGDQSSCDPSPSQDKFRKQRKQCAKPNVSGKINSISRSIEKSSTQVLGSPGVEDTGGAPDSSAKLNEDQNEQAKEGTAIPIIIALPYMEIGSPGCGISGGKRSHRSNSMDIVPMVIDQEQQVTSSIQEIVDNSQSEIQEPSMKKRRGRPKKTPAKSTETPMSGNAQTGDVDSGDLNREDDGLWGSPQAEVIRVAVLESDQQATVGNLANDRSYTKHKIAGMMKSTLPSMHKEKGEKDSAMLREHRRSKRGKQKTAVQCFLGASEGKTMRLEKVGGEVQSNEFENEPLSKWMEEIHSPSVNGSARSPPAVIMEQCISNGEMQRDGVVVDKVSGVQLEGGSLPSASVDKGSSVPREPQKLPTAGNTIHVVPRKDSEKQTEIGLSASALAIVRSELQSMPFVKNTSLWETIESMEAFQKFPQSPHFQPLEQVRESSYREGLAIGHMVTFASLVQRTSNLQIGDPKSIGEDIMGTVVELERHGFDVSFIHERATEFLEVKNKEEKLVDVANNLKKLISECDLEKSRIDGEKREIEEHLRKLQEKLLLAESTEQECYGKAASLQAQLRETEEGIQNLMRNLRGSAFSI